VKIANAVDNPIFDIQDEGYYVGLWFLAGRQQDWLALLYKNPGDSDFRLTYRFRYYRDNKVFFDETEDEKRDYSATCDGKTEAESIAIVDGVVQGLINEGYLGTRLPWAIKKRYTRRLIRDDGHTFKRILLTLPFVHAKELPKRQGRN
jgi:hypothetical protein